MPPRFIIQLGASGAVLPNSMETRPRNFHTETRKKPSLPSSYRPISLLDTIGKLFERILFSRIVNEVSGRELLHD
jgi:hypothetical protein